MSISPEIASESIDSKNYCFQKIYFQELLWMLQKSSQRTSYALLLPRPAPFLGILNPPPINVVHIPTLILSAVTDAQWEWAGGACAVRRNYEFLRWLPGWCVQFVIIRLRSLQLSPELFVSKTRPPSILKPHPIDCQISSNFIPFHQVSFHFSKLSCPNLMLFYQISSPLHIPRPFYQMSSPVLKAHPIISNLVPSAHTSSRFIKLGRISSNSSHSSDLNIAHQELVLPCIANTTIVCHRPLGAR